MTFTYFMLVKNFKKPLTINFSKYLLCQINLLFSPVCFAVCPFRNPVLWQTSFQDFEEV